MAQWQAPFQKALASVTVPVTRTAKNKTEHKQTNKRHKNETQNKIKNVNSLCISRFGFILAKEEKFERRTKASKKIVETSVFLVVLASCDSRASLARLKRNEIKQQQLCTIIHRTCLYIFLPSLHFCDTQNFIIVSFMQDVNQIQRSPPTFSLLSPDTIP